MKKTEKIRYEVDPHNRLVYEKTGRKSDVPGFRTVVDGKFEIDKDNQVIYHVKKAQGSDIPQQLKLKGKWALDDEHNLALTLDKWGDQIAGNKLTLKSELIDAKDNMLAFSLTTKDSKNNTHIYIVKLGGRWQADKYNRLTFQVNRTHQDPDLLTLNGCWQLNNNQQIIYKYQKEDLATKSKKTESLLFKGFWKIGQAKRITYILEGSSISSLTFRVQLETPNLYPKEGAIKYRVGFGLKDTLDYKEKLVTVDGEQPIHDIFKEVVKKLS